MGNMDNIVLLLSLIPSLHLCLSFAITNIYHISKPKKKKIALLDFSVITERKMQSLGKSTPNESVPCACPA